MKILLTQRRVTDGPLTPVAIMDLAAYGRKFGHDITVGYVEDQAALDYEAIGFSALQYDHDTCRALVDLRHKYQGKIVLGGKSTTTLDKTDYDALKAIGIQVAFGDGELWLAPNEKIDFASYPVWEENDFRALDPTGAMTEAMSSRGCCYNCFFCHNTEPQVRLFSVERTVANATLILEKLKRYRVFFVDDIFTLKASRMMELLRAADRAGLELRKRTNFFIHVNHLSPDIVDAIDALAPSEMQMGIESGDDGMLKAMGKTFVSAKAEEKLRTLHGRGHRVACLFLMGFPGETRQSLQATVDFVQRNRKYMSGWWVSYYQPVPHTVGWRMVQERAGKRVDGTRNTEITYLDPNLTESDLTTARKAVMTY